jgi:DNA-binding winged helix-turn-helix (wHTH) protein/energy-coupling factor transporter ATP-binding protein EcfA2
MGQQTQPVYEFLGFQLDVRQRVLIRDGNLIALTPKAFDVLLFLIQNRGRVLEKDELMKAIWPESFVEEGNLSQNIFVLRKILADPQNGDSVIQTIPRRGYKFVASVKELDIPAIPSNAKSSAHSFLSAEYWSQHSPFRGLQIFEPDDAWLFFGRDSETGDLLFRLDRSPVLAVIGNSGCGKSSLIRAGLIPALRAGKFQHGETPIDLWRVVITRPSEAPFDYLAEVLPAQLAPELTLKEQADFVADCRTKLPLGEETLRNAICVLANATTRESDHARILLVVDQFEELFTLTTKHDVRERYIDALLAAARWDSSIPIHVLLLLRADFYSHCLEHPGLSRCLEMNLYNVPRMTQDQLRETIEKRLALAGAHAEPGLIDSLLDDVGTEPGDLALLEHALTQLWERCGGFGCTLTNAAYSVIGRLRGALSAHADEVCGRITDDAQRRLAQKIFLELVHLGGGAPDTRRRVRKQELLSLGVPEEVESLLARLTASRLITMGGEGQETFAEVSHEALIREWSTLREWITQNRDELQLERRLGQAAQEWQSLNRDTGALLQGARLAQGEDWLVRHPMMAPALVRDFLQASIAAHADAEARELRKQKIAATHLRWFSCALASLLLIAIFMTWFARRQQLLAESRALAMEFEEMLSRDQGRALDLAVRGWNTSKTEQTRVALTKAWPQSLSILRHDGDVVVAVFSPDGVKAR